MTEIERLDELWREAEGAEGVAGLHKAQDVAITLYGAWPEIKAVLEAQDKEIDGLAKALRVAVSRPGESRQYQTSDFMSDELLLARDDLNAAIRRELGEEPEGGS